MPVRNVHWCLELGLQSQHPGWELSGFWVMSPMGLSDNVLKNKVFPYTDNPDFQFQKETEESKKCGKKNLFDTE